MRKYALIVMSLLCFSGMAFSAQKKKTKTAKSKPVPQSSVKLEEVSTVKKKSNNKALLAWIENLKKRIHKTNAQSKQLVAVAAVRGTESIETPPLYWKGKKAEGMVAIEEVKEFEQVIETVENGDPEVAKEQLRNFISSYPKSSLLADAQETLSKMEIESQ
ncbi:MAG: hypothetical protein KCHDKBKB_00545 [Elusimicrobia bacterium]|nr:hypothetical protein [Elusimicrobiota bacterium]